MVEERSVRRCGGPASGSRRKADPDGIEGSPGVTPGLSLLDVETVMTAEKTLTVETARDRASGAETQGYHMHIGKTRGPDCANAWLTVRGQPEGAASPNGRIIGSYLHGIFAADAFRSAFVARLGGRSSKLDYAAEIEATLDALAQHLEAHLDIDRLLLIAKPPRIDARIRSET